MHGLARCALPPDPTVPTSAAGGGSGRGKMADWPPIGRCRFSLKDLGLHSALPFVDPNALAQLMADHTALDWRPLLPHITIPCLNVVGRKVGLPICRPDLHACAACFLVLAVGAVYCVRCVLHRAACCAALRAVQHPLAGGPRLDTCCLATHPFGERGLPLHQLQAARC